MCLLPPFASWGMGTWIADPTLYDMVAAGQSYLRVQSVFQ